MLHARRSDGCSCLASNTPGSIADIRDEDAVGLDVLGLVNTHVEAKRKSI